MLEAPFLSIVIPAYNEEKRLPATLTKVFDFLATQPYTAEVLVAENGSQDATVEIVHQSAARHPQLRLLQESGRGKGRAVRSGMLAARGAYRYMADADLSTPIEEVNRFLPPQLEEYDVAIASREASGAVRYGEPTYRHVGGRFINLIIRALALPGLHDTQCGFKCFKAGVAQDLFSKQTLNGFAFDVEVLYIARLRGYRIVEVPVPWYFNAESKVSVVRDSLRMIADIYRIRRNAYAIINDKKKT